MNLQRSNPINISRYGRSRHKSHDFEELSCLRTTESHQSFSPNLGSPSPPETPDSSHCISRIGDYLLLEPLEGDHVFRAAHLHSGEELVCKVSMQCGTRTLHVHRSQSSVFDSLQTVRQGQNKVLLHVPDLCVHNHMKDCLYVTMYNLKCNAHIIQKKYRLGDYHGQAIAASPHPSTF